jgi:hypothetical protein
VLREAALEVWYTTQEPATETTYAKLINCKLYDNMITGSGTGWKCFNHYKVEWCAFYGGRETKAEYRDCYIEDNYFWGERRHLMKSVPTTTKNGKVINKCKECGEVESTKIIYKASNVKLGQATFVYNGKAKNPKVIVKDSKGNTIAQKYYTVVKPTGRTNVGKYTYTIKFTTSEILIEPHMEDWVEVDAGTQVF